jgi:hypothetical protein
MERTYCTAQCVTVLMFVSCVGHLTKSTVCAGQLACMGSPLGVPGGVGGSLLVQLSAMH